MADPGRLDELKRKFDENPRRYFAPLANEYRKAGEPDMAIELCRTYLPQQPSHMSGYIVYGQALHDAGRDEAAAVFNQALALDPENIIALRQLGDIARAAGDGDAAIRWYRKVLELDPRNEEIASFISALESPGAPEQRRWSGPERSAPPPIRPEPEHDGDSLALEDLVSQPDVPRVTPAAPVPAYGRHDVAEPEEQREETERPDQAHETEPAEQPQETAETHASGETGESGESEVPSPSLVEITFEAAAFEAVDWPTVTPAEQGEAEQRAEQSTEQPSADGFWVEQPAAEERAEAEPAQGEAGQDEATQGEEGGSGQDVGHGGFVEEFVAGTFIEPSELAIPAAPSGDEAAHELLRFSDYVPDAEASAEVPIESMRAAETEAPEAPEAPTLRASDVTPSPFVTETMAELYLQQGLRGEALAIYRQLAVHRDDPALRQRIAELEHTAPPAEAERAPERAPEAERSTQEPQATGESVRAFFARIGAQQPDEHPRMAAEGESGLASLFSANAVEDSDIAAAQSLAGAFATPGRSSSPRD